MSEGADSLGGTQGKTRIAEVAERAYRIVKRILQLVLLYSASHWLVVHSPILRPAQLADTVGFALFSLAIAGAAILLTSILGYLTKKTWRSRTEEQKSATLWSVFTISSVLCFVLLIFSASTWIFSTSKLTETARASAEAALSNASTFALFVVASLISIMALFGWQNLSSHIDTRVEKISEDTKEELIGRFFAMTGHTMGELNLTEGFEAENLDRMKTAVEFCRLGFEKLKTRKPGPRMMALNNLTYYQALLKDPVNARWLLDQAKDLLEIGHEYRVPRLLLTYCRVVACYATDTTERNSARALLARLLDEAPLELQERKEALHCQSLFSDDDFA